MLFDGWQHIPVPGLSYFLSDRQPEEHVGMKAIFFRLLIRHKLSNYSKPIHKNDSNTAKNSSNLHIQLAPRFEDRYHLCDQSSLHSGKAVPLPHAL